MNINEFKEGDRIHRDLTLLAGSETPNGYLDRSYQGTEFEFVGIESGIALLLDVRNEEIRRVELDWYSEGWAYWPETLYRKAVNRLKELSKKRKE